VFALLSQKNKKRHAKYWALASLTCLAVAVPSLFYYDYLRVRWTCSYRNLPEVVVGSTIRPEAGEYARSIRTSSCARLLDEYGENWEVWNEEEIEDRYLVLVSLFSTVVILFSFAVMFMLQAWRSSGQNGGSTGAGDAGSPTSQGP
jgi:hypothetical protein